jgi:hypothetical protein
MPSAVQFGAIHYIVGPANRATDKRSTPDKRDEIVDAAKALGQQYLSLVEIPGFLKASNAPTSLAGIVLTGSDVPPTETLQLRGAALQNAVRQYLKTHKETDANGQPIQFHQLLTWKDNFWNRLWYANPLARWVKLNGGTVMISKSPPNNP